MSDKIIMTKHGTSRVKDRVGGKKSKAWETASRAFDCGLTRYETKGSLRVYLDKLYFSYGVANNLRVYHHSVYVFRGVTLITVIALPSRLCALADELQKKKVHEPVAERDFASVI